MSAPVLPSTEGSPGAMSGELLPPPAAGPYSPPQSRLDLAYRIWATLTWSRVWQVVVLLLAVAAIVAGLGMVLHAVSGTAGVWTALGGATGAGASAGGAHMVRRRASRRRGQPAAGKRGATR
jgi:hypothetical protein